MPKLSFSLIATLSVFLTAAAFAPIQQNARKQSALSALIVPPAVEVNVAASQRFVAPQSSIQDGVQKYLSEQSVVESSTLSLSLKERPPPPTAEELAAKKRNFNLWFWGGGFVAPFVATVYYFGPKFWTK